MKISNRIIACGLAAVLCLGGATAFAASADTAADAAATDRRPRVKQELTEEQKASMKAKREEHKSVRDAQKAKWDTMTADQKSAFYDLADQQAAIEIKMIDLQLQNGLIDAETAAARKEQIAKAVAEARASGVMPGVKGGGRPGHLKFGDKPGSSKAPGVKSNGT